jgi:hypothetical protein
VNELKITQERKGDGTTKEEDFDVTTSKRNIGRGKKNITFSLRFHFLQKIILMVSKCIVVHFLVHFQVEVSPSHIVASQEVSSSPFSHFHVLFFALMLKVMVLRSSNKLRLKLKRVMALKNLGAPHFCLFSTVERIREQAFVIVELHP